MFNRNAGIILLIALAAGLGLLAAQQVFAPVSYTHLTLPTTPYV